LEYWQRALEQNPLSSDDDCLDFAYNNLPHESVPLKPVWLNKSYLRMPWWPHVKPVILHPLLPNVRVKKSPRNIINKQRRFYPEKCQKKKDVLYFPRDCIIDTETREILKVEGSEIIDVQSIQVEFWIYPEYFEY
jgi:hypothetical protein